MIHYIDELGDLKGKKVLLRLDLNVPIEDGKVTDPYRIEKSIETIDLLRDKGAQVIILAHCEGKESKTLVPMWHYLNGYVPVEFCPTFFTPEAIDKLLKLEDRGVLLFENVRINPEEKENDTAFAKKLSQMADIYVNDAFSVSHRKHASIVGVPEFLPHYGGPLLKQEIENISQAFNPAHPFVFILGGAKFDTKLPLIKKYLDLADTVFVGGALTNDIFKEKGYEVGTSLVSENDEIIKQTIKEILHNPKLEIPVDVTSSCDETTVEFREPENFQKNECIVDAGPKTIDQLRKLVDGAKTIVWNGPLGNFEKGFGDKTEQLAEVIAEATENGARSIVGGGDTLSAIKKLGLEHKFSFVSTGGGAMLDFLVNETLPGIEALKK
ncbi:MAG: phosphoglycerate kinase [bacterium]